MYQVLARKWRPHNFDELVGQRHVAQALTNAVESDRLAHAYIFAGLRGSGKTTVARILAKCLNCESGTTATPCDNCSACSEIAESRALDVLEIDAASRTKVEQTRELLEMVSYAPVRDRFKILIIDEAHMLSKASFNALLKTLEEPPPNVIFVLATTELQKVLPTIISRCQVFEFRRIAARGLVPHLRKVCDAEQIKISDLALDRIARAGEGSVRDSLSVLERVLAFCGNEVADEQVLRVVGAVDTSVLCDTVRGLGARDAGAMLTTLDKLVDEGHDLLHFWNELIAALRDLLLIEAAPDGIDLLSRAPEDAAELAAAAEGLGREDLVRAFQILADLEPGLRSSAQPRYLFETALIRLASLGAVRPIEEVLRELGTDGGPAPTPTPSPRRSRAPAKQKKNLTDAPVDKPRAIGGGTAASRLVSAVLEEKPMVGAILEQASSIDFGPEELVIHLDASLAPPLKRRECLEVVQRCAQEIAGRPFRVQVDSAGDKASEPAPPERSHEAAPRPAPAPEPNRRMPPEADAGATGKANEENGNLMDRAKRDPGVRQLLREFGAQVIEVKPRSEQPSDKPPEDHP
jgi:DNA polymerase-3 subunit gamma/tau